MLIILIGVPQRSDGARPMAAAASAVLPVKS
jgi:hypothetical protein